MISLSVKNYQIIEDLQVDINGLFVIFGKSNNGKSSLIRSIKSSVFGRRGDDCIRMGSGECVVSVRIVEDRFVWGRDRGKGYFFECNGKRFEKTGGVAPEEYLKKWNVDESNFSGQFDSLFIVSSSPVEAALKLSHLFSGDVFPTILKDISGCIRDKREELISVDSELRSLVSMRSSMEKTLSDTVVLDSISVDGLKAVINELDDIFTLVGKADTLGVGLERVDEEIVGVRKGIEVCSVLDSVCIDDLVEMDRLLYRWGEVEDNVRRLDREIVDIRKGIEVCSGLDSIRVDDLVGADRLLCGWEEFDSKLADINDKMNKVVLVFNSFNSLNEEAMRDLSEVFGLESRWFRCVSELERVESVLSEVGGEYRDVEKKLELVLEKLRNCPVCGSSVDPGVVVSGIKRVWGVES